MSRRAQILSMLTDAVGGGVVVEKVLTSANLPLYRFMTAMYSLMGVSHGADGFTEADLLRYDATLDMGSYGTTVTSLSCGSKQVMPYMKNVKRLLCNGLGLTGAQDCHGMSKVEEIRMDGTQATAINIKDCVKLQSVRYPATTKSLVFDGNTQLKMNIL